ncbi:MAG: response regulator [Tabrizicola sp.]|nr:response regulator [Tabrizicola sp.]
MLHLSPSTDANADRLREEIARQHEIATNEFSQRVMATALAFAICAIFAPAWLMGLLFAINFSAEVTCDRAMNGLDPAKSPWRYRAAIWAMVTMEATLMIGTGLVWLEESSYAKAVAVGISMATLLHLSSIRSIHLPMGSAGIAAVGAVAFIFNTYYWTSAGDWRGLVVCTITASAGLGYAAVAMVSNHKLHRASAAAASDARASDAAKGRFLAQISHELRTPLNAVIGLGEIEAASATGQTRERLKTMVTSARDLSVMLDDALDYSALTDGRVPISPRPAVIRSELAALVFIFETQARKQGRDIRLSVAKEVPKTLRLDSQRLRQCLSNLIGNAIKHASGGPVLTTVGYEAPFLVIDVSDEGEGIPEELRERIFEPFFRGSGESPGVGLGLAISRALAQQMGGDLVLVPTPRGTTFRLSVEAPEVADAAPKATTSDFTGRTVLVVDDIATNRLVAAQLTLAAGAQVVEAASGAEALERLERGGIDLVLLDMMMPEMDGQETLRRIRARPGPRVPVVAMTADILAARREAQEAEPLDGFLPKPILPETLRAVLASVLAKRDG